MEVGPNLLLNLPLRLPVRIREIDGYPKLIAGGIPVAPINLILRQRKLETGATGASLNTYTRAARLYVEFCAYRGQSLVNISNEEFILFKNALIGSTFPDLHGHPVSLRGRRNRRTADLMMTLLYSLASDISARYDVAFDWLRYKGIPNMAINALRPVSGSASYPSPSFRRLHSFRWTPPKILGLPDDQFACLIRAAYERWGQTIADGDTAFAADPEAQRGALFYRNLALLFVLRYTGSRRSEVVQVELDDIDRNGSMIYLATKGQRRGGERRLPVVLFPWVRDIIWHYVTHFRSVTATSSAEDQRALFVSHSVRNYGRKLSDQSVRAVITTLRSALKSPWDTSLTPHMLRHSFGYDLQKYSGPAAVVTNMRHASSRSGEPYAAGPELFADDLLRKSNVKIEQLLAQTGLLEVLQA